ncbi:MAG: hypothetical protein INF44_02580 [Thalassospira sp.]|jgi:hypothetical protein|nr:hypothetical protein [Thalassospira sp.]
MNKLITHKILVLVSFACAIVAAYLFDIDKIFLAAVAAWVSALTMLLGVHLIMVLAVVDMLKDGKK